MTSCLIYRSEKKAETYLYLPVGVSFDDLPEDLLQAFGEPALVMKLDIESNSKLAQADPGQVLTALENQGYFLQLPPKQSIEDLISRKFS